MNDIRGVHVRTVRKWNIGRIKFNPAVQREIIVGGRCLIPGNHHDRFHEVTKYWIDQKKKSASRTIHFQFSNSFYFSIVIYTELNVQNSLPIYSLPIHFLFYTFPSSPKEITIFLILFTSNVTLHTRRILYF